MDDQTKQLIKEEIVKNTANGGGVAIHLHNGVDSLKISPDLTRIPVVSVTTATTAPTDSAEEGSIRVLYDGTNYVLWTRQNKLWKSIILKNSTSYSFGGTGSDGALSISSSFTSIDCGGLRVKELNYTSISITGTGYLVFSNPHAGGTIIILKSQGDVTLTSSATSLISTQGMGAAGGSQGNYPTQNNGSNPNFVLDTVAHGGQTTTGGSPFTQTGVLAYTVTSDALYAKIINITPGAGGAGGAGGNDGYYGNGGSGGAGGRGAGALYIECAGSLNFSGTINCNGGTGSNGGNTPDPGGVSGGGGGGGAAGMCLILYNSLTANTGTITTTGGTGGSGGTSSKGAGGAGGAGATGGAGGGGGRGQDGNGSPVYGTAPGGGGAGSLAGTGGNGGITNWADAGSAGTGTTVMYLVAKNTNL